MQHKKKVIDVSAQLFGTFDGELHSAFVYALMIYIWCAEESPRQNCVLALILQYVNTSQGGLAQLKVQCGNMFQGSITADNMVNIFPAGQMEKTAGFRRLDPNNSQHFAAHWCFLWQCVCAILTEDWKEASPSEIISELSVKVFPAQQADETCKHFFNRLHAAYVRCKMRLTAINRKELLPHPDCLVDLVYTKALKKYTQRVLWNLEHVESLDEKDLTLDVVVSLYQNAAQQKGRTFDAISAALKDPIQKNPTAKKINPSANDSSQPSLTQNSSQSKAQKTSADDSSKETPPRLDDALVLPNPMAGTSTEARRSWDSDNCGNCNNHHSAPAHATKNCPFRRLDGKQWYGFHRPIEVPGKLTQPKPLAAPALAGKSLAPAQDETPGPEEQDEELPPAAGIRMPEPRMPSNATAAAKAALARWATPEVQQLHP